jgi:uncharacterized protein (DUF362 family)
MEHKVSRRGFIRAAAAAAAATPILGVRGGLAQSAAPTMIAAANRSVVSLVHGQNRRQNVHDALVAIQELIVPVLKQKKYVVIKPNLVSTVNQLAATHADALRGILDFLGPRFRGPVMIAESSAGYTLEGYDNFGYTPVLPEFKSQKVSLVDLNEEAGYKLGSVIDGDLHVVPVRLAARLLDPEAYVICSAVMKTHNVVVATLSIKNMTLGAPLHNPRKETKKWNDKRLYHGGVRQTHVDMLLTAQKMKPFWGATVIDGYEGMEGNGPSSGLPVASRIAIASTDYVAADRVGIETMGINPEWVGYLNYCGLNGIGQSDLANIDVRGEALASVVKKYQLHPDIERQLQWMGPMTDLPPRLG